jgi:hypothetical protein
MCLVSITVANTPLPGLVLVHHGCHVAVTLVNGVQRQGEHQALCGERHVLHWVLRRMHWFAATVDREASVLQGCRDRYRHMVSTIRHCRRISIRLHARQRCKRPTSNQYRGRRWHHHAGAHLARQQWSSSQRSNRQGGRKVQIQFVRSTFPDICTGPISQVLSVYGSRIRRNHPLLWRDGQL